MPATKPMPEDDELERQCDKLTAAARAGSVRRAESVVQDLLDARFAHALARLPADRSGGLRHLLAELEYRAGTALRSGLDLTSRLGIWVGCVVPLCCVLLPVPTLPRPALALIGTVLCIAMLMALLPLVQYLRLLPYRRLASSGPKLAKLLPAGANELPAVERLPTEPAVPTEAVSQPQTSSATGVRAEGETDGPKSLGGTPPSVEAGAGHEGPTMPQKKAGE